MVSSRSPFGGRKRKISFPRDLTAFKVRRDEPSTPPAQTRTSSFDSPWSWGKNLIPQKRRKTSKQEPRHSRVHSEPVSSGSSAGTSAGRNRRPYRSQPGSSVRSESDIFLTRPHLAKELGHVGLTSPSHSSPSFAATGSPSPYLHASGSSRGAVRDSTLLFDYRALSSSRVSLTEYTGTPVSSSPPSTVLRARAPTTPTSHSSTYAALVQRKRGPSTPTPKSAVYHPSSEITGGANRPRASKKSCPPAAFRAEDPGTPTPKSSGRATIAPPPFKFPATSPDMASKGFLHPIAAQGYGVVSPAKAKAVRAAKEMQESIEKAKLRGGQDPPFEFVELIGKGGFGRVFKAQDLQTNQMVAVKVIDLDATDITAHHRYREDTLVDFLKEIEILRTLRETNARNVNMIFDAFAVNSGVWIVSEWCAGGSLSTLMKASPSPGLAEKYVIPIAREVAEGLKWVHSVGIIHRDIKAENLLVAEDGRVQLCDFGISALLESHSNKRTTIQGTPWHMPPEMLEGMFNPMLRVQYGAEIDIWAYGCTLYQIATGASPNNTVGGNDLIAAVKANLPQLHGAKFSANLCDLVSYCLKPSPTERPPIESVQQHYCLFNSARRYPTSLLRELLEDFTIWEQSGGQRNSLYVQSGAAVSADAPIDPEDEPWNFSTTEDFEKSVEAKRVSVLGPSAPSILESQQTSEEDVQNRTITAARPKEHRRIPLLPLERLFVKDDNYNYVERDKPSFTAQPSSDLPLRSQNQNSSIRDTMIDLGEFDAGSGTARIPALDTIRANKVQAPSFNSLEGDNRTPSPTEPQEEPSRRDTLAWTFPTTVIQKSDPKKLDTVQETEAAQRSVEQTAKGDTDRAQLDWKFPDLDKASSIPNVVVAPDVDQLDVPGKENDRRATMEWSLAAALSESKAAKQADLSSTHRSSITSRHRQQQRPKPLHSVTGPVPTTLTNQPLQESVSAPVSPPRGSVIYLDDYLPRPSTTEPTALPASSTVDPDDPFGIEIGSDLGRSNRSSSHRQSKSDSTLGVPTTESGLLPWEQQHQRQSSRLNEQLSPDSDQEPHVFDARAKQEWKQDFYKQWKDHAAFNPVSTDTKVSKGSHLWDRPDEEKHGMTTHDRPLPLLPSQPRSGEADDPTNRSGSISSSDHEPTPLPDQSELDRYLAQPAPAPPSAAAMADDADPQELVSELERMLGGFQEGLGVFGRAIETEEERRQRLNGLDGDDDE